MKLRAALTISLAMTALITLTSIARGDAPLSKAGQSESVILADDIPVAHTPPGGYGNTFPPPVLSSCTEPLVEGAPDLRGIWKVIRVEREGKQAPDNDRLYNYVERIEQCGNRIIDMGGGTIADGRADGTAKNGIHDVLVFDYTTPIHVAVTYDDGNAYILHPLMVGAVARALPWLDIPWNWLPFRVPGVKVTRRLNAEGQMVWSRPDQGFVATLERIGGPNDPYTRRDLPNSTRGGSGLPLED